MVRLAVVGVLVLVATACSGSAGEPKEGPNLLAVVDETGNVVVVGPDGEEPLQLTEDDVDALYSQPTWSPDGRSIAWGQVTPNGFSLALTGLADPVVETIPMTGLPFYIYWSPDSSLIGVLHNGENGLDFEMVDVEAAGARVVGQGSPFYFSWNPDSSHVAVHAQGNRFERVSPSGDVMDLGETGQGYLAPQWSEEGIFHVVDGQLSVEEPDGDRRPVFGVSEFTTFVVNPQGTRVALQTTDGSPDLTVSLLESQSVDKDAVLVVDVESGDYEIVSPQSAVGFFWSPDGDSLLVLTAVEELIEHSVWTNGEATVSYGSYTPSPVFVRDVLPFFPQYAQSTSFWSPDSTAFSYATNEGIWIQGLDGTEPELVSGGIWVSWSP